MDDNNTRIVATALVATFAIFGGCTLNTDRLISADIANGVHPMDAHCAHSLNTDRSACAIRAASADARTLVEDDGE